MTKDKASGVSGRSMQLNQYATWSHMPLQTWRCMKRVLNCAVYNLGLEALIEVTKAYGRSHTASDAKACQ